MKYQEIFIIEKGNLDFRYGSTALHQRTSHDSILHHSHHTTGYHRTSHHITQHDMTKQHKKSQKKVFFSNILDTLCEVSLFSGSRHKNH